MQEVKQRGLVPGHEDMAGMFKKIDGVLTADLSTKHWLKQRWTDRLNNPNINTDIIDKLYVESKDGWMVWERKMINGQLTGVWTDM